MKGRGVGWAAVQLTMMGAYLAFPWRRPDVSPASLAGLAVFGAGGLLFLAGFFRLGRALTPLPVPGKDARLETGGIYGLARHPVYGGLILLAFGWAAATGDLPRFAAALALAAFFHAKAALEERILTDRFPEYPAYARRVKRFIPWVY